VRIAGERRETLLHRQLLPLLDNDAIVVKRLLAEIMEAFDEAKKLSSEKSPDELTLSVDRDDSVLSIAKKIRTLATRRQIGASLGKKMAWALFEEKQLNKLIEDVTRLVNDLVDLFPAAKETQHQLCLNELSEIVDTRNDEQGLTVLRTTSDGIDETMKSVVEEAVETRRSHSYVNISATDQARVANGDHINEGVYTAGHGHSYRDISASGSARIVNGNIFGGRSIWDD
jgi:Prion-inhibition and propagation